MTWKLNHVETDYSADEAWLVMEITKESIRHRDRMIAIAVQYERRVQAGRVLDTGPRDGADAS